MLRRIFFMVVASALLLTVAACGGKSSSSVSVSAARSPGADMVPASSAAFISINTDPAGAQWKKALELLARVPAIGGQLGQFLDQNVGAGVTLDELQQALGKTTDIVLLASGSKQSAVLMSKPDDATKLKEILGRNADKIAVREIDGWVVSSDSEAALDRFESARKEGKLSDSSKYADALADLPENALATVFVDGSKLTDVASSMSASNSSGFSLPSGLGTGQMNPVEWMGLAVRARDDGLHLNGIVKGTKGVGSFSPLLLAAVPADAAFALDLKGSALGLEKIVNDLRNDATYGKQITALETMLQIKLEDLARLAGSEMAAYGNGSAFTLLVGAPDAAKSVAMIDKLISLVGGQLSGLSAPSQATIDGVDAKKLTLGSMTVYYGVKDGRLFVTTGASGLTGAGKLSESASYLAATKAIAMPAENAGVVFVDFARLNELLTSQSALLGQLGQLGGQSTTTPGSVDLTGLSTLAAYIAANGDKVKITGLLAVK